jgi:hypothetical protein
LIGRINKEAVIYKSIACNVIVAGFFEVDAGIVVVADSIACNGVIIAGFPQFDAVKPIAADSIACNGVIVAKIPEDDAVPVITGIAIFDAIVARITEANALDVAVADIISGNAVVV